MVRLSPSARPAGAAPIPVSSRPAGSGVHERGIVEVDGGEGGLADEGRPDQLDLDGARPARVVSRKAPLAAVSSDSGTHRRGASGHAHDRRQGPKAYAVTLLPKRWPQRSCWAGSPGLFAISMFVCPHCAPTLGGGSWLRWGLAPAPASTQVALFAPRRRTSHASRWPRPSTGCSARIRYAVKAPSTI
jgi:hypothetical protein